MEKINKLWTCPKCGGQFFQKNLWHSCTVYTEEEFLQGKSERAIQLYKFFLSEYKKIGPITLHVIKSRIAFMVLVRFSGINKTRTTPHIPGHGILLQQTLIINFILYRLSISIITLDCYFIYLNLFKS
jgi:hypothetical protein